MSWVKANLATLGANDNPRCGLTQDNPLLLVILFQHCYLFSARLFAVMRPFTTVLSLSPIKSKDQKNMHATARKTFKKIHI